MGTSQDDRVVRGSRLDNTINGDARHGAAKGGAKMRGKLVFVAGLAIGYVLGSRAGRERYEQLTATARKLRDNPTVQEAAGLVQAHAGRMVSSGRDIVTDRLGHTRIGERIFGHHEPHESHTWPNGSP